MEKVKTYIGVKRVEAWPQFEFEAFPAKNFPSVYGDPLGQRGRPGYAVRYDDGYTSWSPADAFEAAYIEAPTRSADQIRHSAKRHIEAVVSIVENATFVGTDAV